MTPRRAPQHAGRASALLALAGMAAASAATAPPAGCAADGLFPGAIELRETLIPSTTPEVTAVPLGSALVPASWSTEGGGTITSGQQCQSYTQLAWSAQSPDHLTGIAFLPEASWVALPRGGTKFVACPDRPYDDAWTYLPDLLKRIQPAAVAGTVRNRGDLAAPVSAQWKGNPAGRNSVSVSAGELPFKVPPQGDAPARDGLLVAIVVAVTTPPGIPEYQTTVHAYPTLLALAPSGQLDPAKVEAVRASGVPNPVWAQALERATRIFAPPAQLPLPTTFKPDREVQDRAPACARGLKPLMTPNLWIAADGRYYFKEVPSP